MKVSSERVVKPGMRLPVVATVQILLCQLGYWKSEISFSTYHGQVSQRASDDFLKDALATGIPGVEVDGELGRFFFSLLALKTGTPNLQHQNGLWAEPAKKQAD